MPIVDVIHRIVMCDSVAATEAADRWDSWVDQRTRQAAEAGSLRPTSATAKACGGSSMAALPEVTDSQGQGQPVVQPASTPNTARTTDGQRGSGTAIKKKIKKHEKT